MFIKHKEKQPPIYSTRKFKTNKNPPQGQQNDYFGKFKDPYT